MAERAYGVIGLGAHAAKIKQVCSVTTRGGERERERVREEKSSRRERGVRQKGGGVQLRSSSQDRNNWWRTSFVLVCSKNSWEWRREEGKEGERKRGRADRKEERREDRKRKRQS